MFPSYYLQNPDFLLHRFVYWYVTSLLAIEDAYDVYDAQEAQEAYYEIYSDY